MESPVMTVRAIILSLLHNISCSRYRISHTFLGKNWIGSVICFSWKYRMCLIPNRRLGMAIEKPSMLWFFRETPCDRLDYFSNESRQTRFIRLRYPNNIQKIIFIVWLWNHKNRESMCSFYFTVAILLHVILINFNIIYTLCNRFFL